jgi:2-oxoglutarate ferredoxin oxidoreductase subunit delta
MAETFNKKGYRPAMLVDSSAECTGCAICAVICPDAAITVYRFAKARPAAATA